MHSCVLFSILKVGQGHVAISSCTSISPKRKKSKNDINWQAPYCEKSLHPQSEFAWFQPDICCLLLSTLAPTGWQRWRGLHLPSHGSSENQLQPKPEKTYKMNQTSFSLTNNYSNKNTAKKNMLEPFYLRTFHAISSIICFALTLQLLKPRSYARWPRRRPCWRWWQEPPWYRSPTSFAPIWGDHGWCCTSFDINIYYIILYICLVKKNNRCQISWFHYMFHSIFIVQDLNPKT